MVEGLAYGAEAKADAKKLIHCEDQRLRSDTLQGIFGFVSDSLESNTKFGSTFAYAGDLQALQEKGWDRKLWFKDIKVQFGYKVVLKMFKEQRNQAAEP